MRYYLASASALALTLAAPAAFAQTFDLGEIVVFANQTETEEDRVGVTVEKLDEEEIAESPTASVADTLARLPGIAVNSNGGLGKSTSLRLRGLNDRYIGVRINGIDVTDPSSVQTQYNWGSLTTGGLSRIEVLKGSQSALYGSEAIAGVINITTFRPTEEGTSYRFGVEYGSFDTIRSEFSVGQKTDTTELAFTLSYVDTNGFSAADENQGNTETDPFTSTTAILSARHAISDQVTLGFEGIWQDSETNIDAGGGVGGDANRPFFTEQFGARIYAEIDAGAFRHEIGVSYFETEREDPLTGFGSPVFSGKRTEVQWKATTDLARGPLTFGAEYSEEKADFGAIDADYEVGSIFAEHLMALSDTVDLTLSGRVDDHSEFGSAVTGRAALAWRLGEATVVRASIGTGYRAPSLNELFGPFNFTTPNPQLDPEESRSAEFGIEHRYGNGAFVKATAFYTEIDNLIGYAGGNYVQTPGTSKAQGIELSGRLPLGNVVSAFASYTYTDSETATGTPIRRTPEHDVVLGFDAEFSNGWAGQIVANHVADRVDGFPAGPVPDYTVVGAQISYDVTDNATAYLRVENLTDTEYQTALGYGTSDRAFYFGIRANF